MIPDPIGNALNRLREQLGDAFATTGADAGMTAEEAERYAGPPPTTDEVAELSALAGELAGSPANVLCEAGFSIPAAMGCEACPRFTTCPALPGSEVRR